MLKTRFSTLTGTVALVLVVASSPAALAHAHLKTQYPAAEAHVDASPQALTLTFSEDIEPAFSRVEITGAAGQTMPTGEVERAPQQHNQLIAPLTKPLPAGSYQVNWHVLSVDGHKTKGNYTFSVK